MVLIVLGKTTLILLTALVLDGMLHRKWLLPTAAMWNAVLLAIVVLLPATLLVPRWVLPLLPSETSKTNLPVSAAQLTTAELSTTPNSIPERARQSIELSPAKNFPGLIATNQPSAQVSTTNAWNVALASLGWIYALGVAIALMRLAANLRAVHRLRCGAIRVTNGNWLARMEHWQIRLGLTSPASGKSLASIHPPARLLQSGLSRWRLAWIVATARRLAFQALFDFNFIEDLRLALNPKRLVTCLMQDYGPDRPRDVKCVGCI
jgi:hypothetical protein